MAQAMFTFLLVMAAILFTPFFSFFFAAKSIAKSRPRIRDVNSIILWGITCILAWGGITSFFVLVLLLSRSDWKVISIWAAYAVLLVPTVVSGLPAGVLCTKLGRKKWVSVLPTFTAFLFLFFCVALGLLRMD